MILSNQFIVIQIIPNCGNTFCGCKVVWEMLRKIPYGKTWSYQQQAIKLNNPKAVRAVANANGHNRIAIILPCHWVSVKIVT